MFKKLTAAAVVAAGLTALPAYAAEAAAPAQITARVTDSTPASGETFRVAGVLTRDGDTLAGKKVQVQTLRNGTWQNISGASMATSSTGKYNLRLILSQKGERKLRVVATVPGNDPAKRFVVTVH
ncbi:hypothetical protein [Nocardioides speluncae]|uniref:hypothetical protein n=1 Tax=Nocardioides speluncae TaxID=2670337 RepID=UPI000D699B67|nr:hypothetical protein [Nocardioides speluncae]